MFRIVDVTGCRVQNRRQGDSDVSNDIVIRLRNWVLCDTPSEMVMLEAADEIERLRNQLQSCDNDFHTLKQLFDTMRQSRDQWRNIAGDLRHGAWEPAKIAYQQAVDQELFNSSTSTDQDNEPNTTP